VLCHDRPDEQRQLRVQLQSHIVGQRESDEGTGA
jgi:hypothetical protein